MFLEQSPFIVNYANLDVLSQALALDNAGLMSRLFNDATLAKTEMADIAVFFGNASIIKRRYAVQDFLSSKARHSGSIFNDFGGLVDWVCVLLPSDKVVQVRVANFLKNQLRLAHRAVFTSNGTIKPWLKRYIGQRRYKALCTRFGKSQLAFSCLAGSLSVYCQHYLTIGDNQEVQCARLLMGLMQYELAQIQKANEQLSLLAEWLSSPLSVNYRLRKQVALIHHQAEQLLYTHAYHSLSSLTDCLTLVNALKAAPFDGHCLAALQKAVRHEASETPSQPWLYFIAASSALLAASLIGVSLEMCTTLPLLFVTVGCVVGVSCLLFAAFSANNAASECFAQSIKDYALQLKTSVSSAPALV